jgi:tetratricopeptide (TPR) repeat protein
VLRLDPGHVQVLQARSLAYLHLAQSAADPAVAGTLADDALHDVDRLEDLHPGLRWPLLLRAQVLSELGRAAEAQAAAQRARALSASTAYEDLFYEAFVAYEANDLDGAIALFTRASTLRPDNVDLIMTRAMAYDRRGKVDLAIQDYRLALALAPDNWVGQYSLGLLLRRAGRLDEGEGFMRRALELQPDEPVVHEELSDQALERGRAAVSAGDRAAAERAFEEAEREARRSLALRDDLPWARVNLGASLMERYRLSPDPALADEALTQYDAALERWKGLTGGTADDAYRGALVNICDALLQTRALERALGRCAEAVGAWPRSAAAHYNLAGAQALLGQSDAALGELEKDLALGDTDWGYLEQDEWFQALRQDPRFLDLLARMKRTAGGQG